MTLSDEVELRCARASAELIGRERDRLSRAVAGNDDVAIRWALGSIAEMVKGLIDIGTAWLKEQPLEAEALHQTTRQAHTLERATRPT